MREAEFETKPAIERNAATIAELEREWSVLGPQRAITFSVYVGDDENVARAFARDLGEVGFETELSSIWPSGQWSVHATRSMEPTAANVTHWEEWFNARIASWEYADDECGVVHFKGWRYPERVAPAFSLEGRIWSNTSAFERGQVLFGQTLADDKVSLKGRYDSFGPVTRASPFQLDPSQFLSRARANRPHHAEPAASKFAQWIYSLYADAYGRAQDLEEGKAAEEAIFVARRRAYACVDRAVLSASFPDWRLVHNGLHFAQKEMPKYLTVCDLAVAGEALRVLPDLIYRNRLTGEIIIVEIKHSRMAIPSNLWPNIWGQLWCYAQLDQVQAAPCVTVIGEVWGDAWTRGNRKVSSNRLVSLRASVRRDPRASAYDRFFRALFDIYRGSE